MTRRVRLEPEAEEELYVAAAHYDRQVRGLGKDFIGATRAIAQRLRRWPNSGSVVDDVDPALGASRCNGFPTRSSMCGSATTFM